MDNNIRDRIKSVCEEIFNDNQSEMALSLGVNHRTLNNVINGYTKQVTYDILFAISSYILPNGGLISAKWLLLGEGAMIDDDYQKDLYKRVKMLISTYWGGDDTALANSLQVDNESVQKALKRGEISPDNLLIDEMLEYTTDNLQVSKKWLLRGEGDANLKGLGQIVGDTIYYKVKKDNEDISTLLERLKNIEVQISAIQKGDVPTPLSAVTNKSMSTKKVNIKRKM